jgi:hypothetical protein
MQDGCRLCIDSYVASNGSCFHVHLDYFQNSFLGGKPNTGLEDHGTPNAHNHDLFCFILCEDPTWIEMH